MTVWTQRTRVAQPAQVAQHRALCLIEEHMDAQQPSIQIIVPLRDLTPTLNRRQAATLAGVLQSHGDAAGLARVVPALDATQADVLSAWVASTTLQRPWRPDTLDSATLAAVTPWVVGAPLLDACDAVAFAANSSTLALRRHTGPLRSFALHMARQHMLEELDMLAAVLQHPEDRVAVFAARATVVPLGMVERDVDALCLSRVARIDLLTQLSFTASEEHQSRLASAAWMAWQSQPVRDQRGRMDTVGPALQALVRMQPTMLPSVVDTVVQWITRLSNPSDIARLAVGVCRLLPDALRARALPPLLHTLAALRHSGAASAAAAALWELCPSTLANDATTIIEQHIARYDSPARALASMGALFDHVDTHSRQLPPIMAALTQAALADPHWTQASAQGLVHVLPTIAALSGPEVAIARVRAAAARSVAPWHDRFVTKSIQALARSHGNRPELLLALADQITPAHSVAALAVIAAAAGTGPQRPSAPWSLVAVERRWYQAMVGPQRWDHPRGQTIHAVVDDKSGVCIADQMDLPAAAFDLLRASGDVCGTTVRLVGVAARNADGEAHLVGVTSVVRLQDPCAPRWGAERPAVVGVVAVEQTTEPDGTWDAGHAVAAFFPDGSLALRGDYPFQLGAEAQDGWYYGHNAHTPIQIRVSSTVFADLLDRAARVLRTATTDDMPVRASISGAVRTHDLDQFIAARLQHDDDQAAIRALTAEIAEGHSGGVIRATYALHLAHLLCDRGAYEAARSAATIALRCGSVHTPDLWARAVGVLAACAEQVRSSVDAHALHALARACTVAAAWADAATWTGGSADLPIHVAAADGCAIVVQHPFPCDAKRTQTLQTALSRVAGSTLAYTHGDTDDYVIVLDAALAGMGPRLAARVYCAHVAMALDAPDPDIGGAQRLTIRVHASLHE